MSICKRAAAMGLMALVLACCIAASMAAHAAPAGTPLLRGNVIRDFARITFSWPDKTPFSADVSGSRLTVRFNQSVAPDFGQVLGALHPYVTKAGLSSDGKTIVFTLRQPYKIRTFLTENENGIDILKIHDPAPKQQEAEKEPEETKVAEVKKPAAEKPKPALVKVKAPAKPQPKPKDIPVKTAEAKPAEKPAEVKPVEPPVAKQAEAPAPKPVEEVKAAPVPAAVTPPVETPAPVQVKTEPAAKVETPAPEIKTPEVISPIMQPEHPVVTAAAPLPATTAPAAATAPGAVPVVPTAATDSTAAIVTAPAAAPVEAAPPPVLRKVVASSITGAPMNIDATLVEDKLALRFPWKTETAAAVWVQGNLVWVLFDQPVTLSQLAQLVEKQPDWLLQADQLGGKDHTLLRLVTRKPLAAIAEKETGSYAWTVRLGYGSFAPAEAIAPEIHAEAEEPYVFLPVQHTTGPYAVKDPETQLLSQVLPISGSNIGISAGGRNFAEFALPETAQGIVVSPLSDRLAVSRTDNGVQIGTKGGLYLSGKMVDEATPDKETANFKPSLFPYRDWKVTLDEDFLTKEKYYLDAITTAATKARKNHWRKGLAQLYLGEGMLTETIGVLATIRAADLDYYRREKLAALEGAAYLLNYRPDQAALAFSSDVLDNNPEGDLLRKAAAASLSDEAEPVPYMEMNDAYIRQYPTPLRQRLAIIAANNAIVKKDYKTASAIFDSLEEDKQDVEIADYIKYLRAKIAAETNKPKEAKRIWQELTSNVEDRQFRARAGFSLALLELERNEISPAEAIERLEKLRIIWRGDDLERSLLSLLGQLYVNNGNYWNGMKVWEELLQSYPNTQDAISAYGRMAETFRHLFLENGAKDMRPLKALALYNEFSEMTPVGNDGNKMIQNLVDSLVAVDLLDEAAARLENQVKYRLQGEEKSMVGARLALIHLLNRNPTAAIAALQDSRFDDVPAALSLERNRLAAQALLNLKKPSQSLVMIEGDYSTEGEAIRLQSYWDLEDWANVIDIIELIFRARPDLEAPFTPEEGQRLLQLTLAYVFQGEYNQLGYLRDAYAPLMENNPYKDEFLFLAQERVAVDPRNFQRAIESINSIEGFMGKFGEKLKKGGLSEAIKPAADDKSAKPIEEKPLPAVEDLPAKKEGAAPEAEVTPAEDATKYPEEKPAATEEPAKSE